MEGMGSVPNLPVKLSVSIGTMFNIVGDGHGHGNGNGTCKQAVFTPNVSVSVSVEINTDAWNGFHTHSEASTLTLGVNRPRLDGGLMP